MFKKKFCFGKEIKACDYYTEARGFGFIDLTKPVGETNARQALYGGGWNLRKEAEEDFLNKAFINQDEGVFISIPRHTLVFRTDVPEYGAYKLTVKIKALSDIRNMACFVGRRNLVERDIKLSAGEEKTAVYYTYVSNYIPAISSVPLDEKAVYFSFNGDNAGISEIIIEEAKVPTVFIAGDSTLTDQNALTPYYRIASCCGWAQVIAQYFKDMAVCNQAHSGLTTNCFRDDGHLKMIEDQIKPGDVLIIQFGHNDQKRRNLAAFGGYINNLRWYVKWAREKGATPIIVSPISRIPIEDDFADEGGKEKSYYSLLEMHAKACKQAALEMNVPFIDLHKLTFNKWCELGIEPSRDYFCKGDITHTDDYGANLLANFVASEIKRQKIEPVLSHLYEKEIAFLDPSSDVKEAPKSAQSGKGPFEVEPPYIDIKGIPEYEGIEDAYKKELLDPCVMFLHPYDIMPRAQFFMVYFKALRIAGKRPYTMKYCDISRFEWDSSYIEAAISENLIDAVTTPNNCFRPDDPMTYEELASLLVRGIKESASERNMDLDSCFADAKELGIIPADADAKAIINRAQCYLSLAKLSDILDTGDKALPSDAEVHPVG